MCHVLRVQKIGAALGKALATESLGEDGAGVLRALLSTSDGIPVAVERIWHTQGSQGQILALALR